MRQADLGNDLKKHFGPQVSPFPIDGKPEKSGKAAPSADWRFWLLTAVAIYEMASASP
jgi:hypothetical protein